MTDRLAARHGTDESPGEVFLYQGRSYKSLPRHEQQLGAMAQGSADRYFQRTVIRDQVKLRARRVEGQVLPYRGSVGASSVHQLAGGLRAAMGYVRGGDHPRIPGQGALHAHHQQHRASREPTSTTSPLPARARTIAIRRGREDASACSAANRVGALGGPSVQSVRHRTRETSVRTQLCKPVKIGLFDASTMLIMLPAERSTDRPLTVPALQSVKVIP